MVVSSVTPLMPAAISVQRVLVDESIYDAFMERALERVNAIVGGDPLDPATMIGAAWPRMIDGARTTPAPLGS